MKADIACIPCILNFCLRTLNFCNVDTKQKEKLFREVVKEMANFSLEQTPAALADTATRIIKDSTGIDDPYRDEKKRQNEMALKLYPIMKEMVKHSENRIKTAITISAIGNIIDLGAQSDYNIENALQDLDRIRFAKSDLADFLKTLEVSKTLLFIADNCGEIIFDRVFLEELSDIKKFVAVKSGPFINDVTIQDIEGTGVEKIARIIETGTSNLEFNEEDTSKEFKEIFNSADIIISKGHANFEALHGRGKNIYFLLRAKCDVVSKVIGVKTGDFIFKRF